MTDAPLNKSHRHSTHTLKWSIGVETVIGYILVPFYVALHLVIPKKLDVHTPSSIPAPTERKKLGNGLKWVYSTWLKSIGVAVSTGVLLGVVEWVSARLLNRRLIDGIPAIATGVGVPALIGAWLIDRKNRWRGALNAVGATLPRILVSESWRRDFSTDEEFDQQAKTAREQLFSVLKEDAARK